MSNPKKPNLVGTGVQKGLLKAPVLDAEFFEQETKRLGMSRAFWEGFRDGYIKALVCCGNFCGRDDVMVVDTKKEAVEAFIQSVLKDHVLSEGMPHTSVGIQDTDAIVELLRSFLEKVEALEAQVAAADALAAWAKAILDRKPSLVTGGRLVLERDLVGLDTTDLVCLDAALAAYNKAKKGGA